MLKPLCHTPHDHRESPNPPALVAPAATEQQATHLRMTKNVFAVATTFFAIRPMPLGGSTPHPEVPARTTRRPGKPARAGTLACVTQAGGGPGPLTDSKAARRPESASEPRKGFGEPAPRHCRPNDPPAVSERLTAARRPPWRNRSAFPFTANACHCAIILSGWMADLGLLGALAAPNLGLAPQTPPNVWHTAHGTI